MQESKETEKPSEAEAPTGPAKTDTPEGPSAPRWWLHILLFVLTLGTTMSLGFDMAEGVPEGATPWMVWAGWKAALGYAGSLLAILFCHEMGHYLTARRYGVEVTPPFFMPGFPPFGTFGAFIKMRVEKIGEKELFRIGAGGPYAGFVVALPLLLVGLLLSEVKDVPVGMEGAKLGDSLLMWGLTRALFGELPAGQDVFLHPMAYAGWVGMFITSFNLVPLGQLDGGHVAYTLFGERFNKVAWVLLLGLIALGVMAFPGWLVLVLFLLFTGHEHPPVTQGRTLRGGDRAAAWGALALFALTFVPRPFVMPTLLDWLRG